MYITIKEFSKLVRKAEFFLLRFGERGDAQVTCGRTVPLKVDGRKVSEHRIWSTVSIGTLDAKPDVFAHAGSCDVEAVRELLLLELKKAATKKRFPELRAQRTSYYVEGSKSEAAVYILPSTPELKCPMYRIQIGHIEFVALYAEAAANYGHDDWTTETSTDDHGTSEVFELVIN